MTLSTYRKKRDFQRTPEPEGKTASRAGHSYCIQKHDASRLHFDFRLELDGVLKSWAVPKGPSLDPAQKHLAVEVEDHPLEYGKFEGTIPAGEYGGGTVMLWDRGTWSPLEDPAKGLRAGRLKFTLQGERLQGNWMLVRIKKDRAGSKTPNWLLIKEKDEYATDAEKDDPIAKYPTSVSTGRTMEEIADGKSARKARRSAKIKSSRGTAKGRQRKSKGKTSGVAVPDAARRTPLPRVPHAQLATLVAAPPEGDDWVHEVKFDGYRMFARVDHGKVRWISRNGKDWTSRLASLSAALAGLPCDDCLVDGEVVVVDEQGISHFELLQQFLSREPGAAEPIYYAFDLLHLDGYDLKPASLTERKSALAALIAAQKPRSNRLAFSDHHIGGGRALHASACAAALEGIISKRANAPYEPGRGGSWLKSKCRQGQELVIGGYTDPAGSRKGFGALLMGYYATDGAFTYAGRVGTGYDQDTLQTLKKRLETISVEKRPFAKWPKGLTLRGVRWVKPKLVAQVEFSNWTGDGLVRQGAFVGLREDKAATTVRRESPEARMKNSDQPSARRKKAHPQADSPPANELPTLTHPERVLYPDEGLTKQDIADYYAEVADYLLPHLVGRPLSIVRCPDGTAGKCFFQKHPPQGLSDAVERIQVREKSGKDTYLMVKNLAGVIALVQFGALELHCWGARADDVERPDRIVFDLDPSPEVEWSQVREAALGVRTVLDELGLQSFLKTSGGKGLHVVVPVDRRRPWADVKAFTRGVAEMMERAAPDHFTTNISKKQRTGKVFIDYLRNERGATSVAAYSTRARAGGPVSLPIAWEELKKLKSSTQYTVENVPRLLAKRKSDPWSEIGTTRQSITASMLKRVGNS